MRLNGTKQSTLFNNERIFQDAGIELTAKFNDKLLFHVSPASGSTRIALASC